MCPVSVQRAAAYRTHPELLRLAGWKSRGCSGIARISVIQSQSALRIRESEIVGVSFRHATEVREVVADIKKGCAPPHQA